MQNNELFKQLLESKNYQKSVKKAEKRFEPKPFAIQFKPLLNIALVSRFILPLFSVITGTLFLANVFESMLDFFIVSLALGFVLVVLLEYSKTSLLQIAFPQLVSGQNKAYIGVFILALCFTLGSGYLSINGSETIYNKLDTTIKDTEQKHLLEKEALKLEYDEKINTLTQELRDYKKSVSWKGHINMTNKANQKIISSLNSRIEALESEKVKEINQLTADQNSTVNTVFNTVETHIFIVLIIVSLIEVFIILVNWFIVYYDFKIISEKEIITEPQKVTFSVNDIQNLLSTFIHNTTNQYSLSSALSEPTTIGFQPSLSNNHSVNKNAVYSGKNTETLSSELSGLISDIKSGLLDYRTLSKKHKVNFTTIKEHIEKYA